MTCVFTSVCAAFALTVVVRHALRRRRRRIRRSLPSTSHRRRPSTLCRGLRRKGFVVEMEGADDPTRWQRTLELFYTDLPRYCYLLQTGILLDMARQYDRLMHGPWPTADGQCPRVVFVERSPESALTFVRNSVEEGHLHPEEHRVYMELHRRMAWTPDYVVSLHVPVEEAIRRMHRRARAAEQSVDADYVRQIDGRYRSAMHDMPSSIVIAVERGAIPTRYSNER